MGNVFEHGKTLRMNYEKEHKRSIERKEEFFAEQARALLSFSKDFTKTYTVDKEKPKITWFEDGEINACYNAVDRHAEASPDKVAIIYEDDSEKVTKITYKELLDQVIIFASYLKSRGIEQGQTVCIYMPMEPNALIGALACARLGAAHTIVFGGFSAESLSLRIEDSDAVWLITSDIVKRGGKIIDYLTNVQNAVEILSSNKNTSLKGLLICDIETIKPERRKKLATFIEVDALSDIKEKHKKDTVVECVPVPAENVLFHLYTSGSTGRPKGLSHSTAGYLLYAALTTLVCFDIQESDIFFCTAEMGWITGHSYVLYGPLTLGITTVVFGGIPTHPDPYRLFRSVERFKATHLYTAPTVIRLLQKSLPNCLVRAYDKNESQDRLMPAVDHIPNSPASTRSIFSSGITDAFDRKRYYKEHPTDSPLSKIDLSSLRVLGSVGEPINKGAYVWFSMYFGGGTVPIVDTYWQTEAGGVMLCPLIGVSEYRPECASFPFFGMDPIVINRNTDQSMFTTDFGTFPTEAISDTGILLFKDFWPGIARTIVKNHERYKHAYFSYSGYFYTGDEVFRDKDGYFWIKGRIDDVINVSGHRLSTAEIESAVCSIEGVSESAALGEEDEVTGQGVVIFIVKSKKLDDKILLPLIKQVLRKKIGPVVSPKRIISCPELPKTSTGKMMRRVLRKILEGEEVGDISTCINPESIEFAKKGIRK